MDHEDFEKLVKLYNDREGFMPKQAALCASAKTTIVALQNLQSTPARPFRSCATSL